MSSEYERERLEKIKRNEELMRELQVMSGSSTIGVPASATKKKPAAAKARPSKPIAPRVKREAPLPTRSSSRLKGHVADTETLKRKVEEEAEEARVRAQEAKRARHADHDLKSLTGGTLLEDELEVLRKSLMKASGRSNVPKSEGDEEHGAAPFSAETIALSKVVNGMQLRSVSKVTPARIYSMAYHPSVDRDLIFMGDKEGNLGVWDALAQQDGGEESEDDMPAGKAWSLQAHGKSPVTCLRFDPISSESLFSSSYDSTLRMFSLASSTSTEVWAGQDDVLLSIFDILAPQVHPTAFTSTPAHGLDERSIWIGDHRGGLVHVDLREGKAKRGGHRWQVSEKKIGAMSVNRAAPHCIATASLDQHVRLFDVRSLKNVPDTAVAPYNYKAVDEDNLMLVQKESQIVSHQSKRACTSVDFSPNGDKLVCVSYDDIIKVWDTDPSSLQRYGASSHGKLKGKTESVVEILRGERAIPHNNQSGRWITGLRARFNGNPEVAPHFTIGGMNRRAEIFSADGTLLRALYDEDYITAVPAVTAMHPVRPGRLATGNASGRANLWA